MLFLAAALLGQSCKPWLRGHLYDRETGAPFPGRTVQAIKVEMEIPSVVETVTNQQGYFEFPHLKRPEWDLSIKAKEPWKSHHEHAPDCGGTNIYVANDEANAKPCRLSLSGYVYQQGSDDALPGHIVRATNGANIVTAVANRNGHFEFLNLIPGDWWLTSDMSGFKPVGTTPFVSLRPDSVCLHRNLHLRRYGPREQLEETVASIPGYAVALYQLVKEALGAHRQR